MGISAIKHSVDKPSDQSWEKVAIGKSQVECKCIIFGVSIHLDQMSAVEVSSLVKSLLLILFLGCQIRLVIRIVVMANISVLRK